jgi:hypothetical protein
VSQLFTPPSERRPLSTYDRLWVHFHYNVGLTLLKRPDGGYDQPTEFPDADTFADYIAVYLGGHVYLVSDAEAANLAAHGYGDFLETPPIDPTDGSQGGYGVGRYGIGAYGDGDPAPPPHSPFGAGPYGEGTFG